MTILLRLAIRILLWVIWLPTIVEALARYALLGCLVLYWRFRVARQRARK